MFETIRSVFHAIRVRRLRIKPDEVTLPSYPPDIRIIDVPREGEIDIRTDPDAWAAEVNYEADVVRMGELVEKRAELRRKRKAATFLDAEMNEIRARMLAYENGRTS